MINLWDKYSNPPARTDYIVAIVSSCKMADSDDLDLGRLT